MREKKEFFIHNYDDIRRFLMHEPRGHKDMFGAVITDSIRDECDFGLLFIDTDGYLDFCGHGVIAATTVMLKLMGLKPKDKDGIVKVDIPAGVVSARPIPGEVLSIAVEAVPSFLVEAEAKIATSIGLIPVDIAYSGNFFAFAKATDLGLEINEKNIPRLVSIALEIKAELNHRTWEHPEIPGVHTVDLIEILDKPHRPDAQARTLLVYGEGQVARDPCASGTCAKVGLEVSKGNMKIGDEIVCEGILGTIYKGKAIRTCLVGSTPAVIPEIQGRTFITGMDQFFLEDDDPLPTGWLIR
jgi:proline racemase/trans-L-3-hydroxyproline dehydratase